MKVLRYVLIVIFLLSLVGLKAAAEDCIGLTTAAEKCGGNTSGSKKREAGAVVKRNWLTPDGKWMEHITYITQDNMCSSAKAAAMSEAESKCRDKTCPEPKDPLRFNICKAKINLIEEYMTKDACEVTVSGNCGCEEVNGEIIIVDPSKFEQLK